MVSCVCLCLCALFFGLLFCCFVSLFHLVLCVLFRSERTQTKNLLSRQFVFHWSNATKQNKCDNNYDSSKRRHVRHMLGYKTASSPFAHEVGVHVARHIYKYI